MAQKAARRSSATTRAVRAVRSFQQAPSGRGLKMRKLQLEIAKRPPVKVPDPPMRSSVWVSWPAHEDRRWVVKCLMKNGVMAS